MAKLYRIQLFTWNRYTESTPTEMGRFVAKFENDKILFTIDKYDAIQYYEKGEAESEIGFHSCLLKDKDSYLVPQPFHSPY